MILPTRDTTSRSHRRVSFRSFLYHGAGLVSILGLLSNGAVWSQTPLETVDTPPSPATLDLAPAPSPDDASAAPSLPLPAPSSGARADTATSVPATDEIESYIDSTSYSLGATQRGGNPETTVADQLPEAASAPTAVAIGPLSVSSYGLGVGQTTVSVREYYNRTSRPPGRLGNNNISLIFPLSIAAPITSVFGWRGHPITGDHRFHSGTDIGAPLGTPVLAAYAGRVAIADFLGGYGLTVTLSHNKDTQQTLYGHLSEIFVRPGDWIAQGVVIGRVGSTGLSTGPHLHFEFRQQTADGWVAMDAGAQLEYALAQLMNGLQVAQLPSNTIGRDNTIGSLNGGIAGTAVVPSIPANNVSKAVPDVAIPAFPGGEKN